MNLPNAITVGRVILVPAFMWVAYRQGDAAALAAFALFLVASLSDFVDGYLARRWGVMSPVGEFLDPLADKLLISAALVVLVDLRGFPLWAALVIAVREVAVQILRTRVVGGGGRLPASQMGKLKTMVQIVTMSWWLLPWDEAGAAHWSLLGVALVVTVLSGAAYFSAAARRGPRVVR